MTRSPPHVVGRVQEPTGDFRADFKTADFPRSDFTTLTEKLKGLSIPFPNFSDGKSGDTHHMEIQSGENAIHLNWYGDSPGEDWKDVQSFANEIVALKNKYIS